ncbi:MAG: methyltransferase domain-containing protein [bacterium]|nr:methyltransferase domain-containing protein [bacterium]
MTRPSNDDARAARKFYDRISSAYDLLSDRSEHAARERGLELLEVAPGQRVLEIGFGTGHALVDLARSVGAGGSVTGVDISEGMRQVARDRVAEAGLDVSPVLDVAAVPPLPYSEGCFDAVFMSFTLELFADDTIPALLAETRRVLRDGGRLGVVAMNDPGPHHESLLERAYGWMHRHFPHIVDCRPIAAEQLVETAGFRVLERDEIEIWSLPVKALVADIPADGGTPGTPNP